MRSALVPIHHKQPRGRAALLLGAALAPLPLCAPAHGQASSSIVLEEGRTPGPVALGSGDDRVTVDIARVNADTGVLDLTGLVDGPLTDEGGRDTVWLRATTSQTRNVVFTSPRNSTSRQDVRADSPEGTAFDGGTVYEASGNDTVLTLENRSRSPIPNDPTQLPNNAAMELYHGPLRLAGDGTAILTFSVGAANQTGDEQQAIRVEAGSTLEGNGGDGRLDLVIQSADVGGGTSPAGLIDVTQANSLRLRDSARVQLREGVGILGGKADIHLEAGTWLNGYNASISDITLIRSSGRVYNSTKISVGGQYGNPDAAGVGVRLEGGKLYNMLTEGTSGTGVASAGLGDIIGGTNGVLAASGFNYIENVGDIRASTGAAIEVLRGTTVLRNTLWNFSKGGSRGGVITGGVIDGNRIAYSSFDAVDLVVNSGTITGDVDLGGKDDMFLYTGSTPGVTGLIEGGNGIDGFGKSFDASATHQLSNDILGNGNSGFEMHGIEARGADTTVTVTSDVGTLDAGLMLIGDGIVVNTADITTLGGAIGVWARNIENVERGLRFVNRGEIRTAGRGFYGQTGLAALTNEGVIRSTDNYAVIVNIGEFDEPIDTFAFDNSGTIETEYGSVSAAHFQFRSRNDDGLVLDAINSGTIRNSGDRESFSDSVDAAFSVNDLSSALNHHRLVNSGLIEGTGRGTAGVDVSGARWDLVNTNAISAHGRGAAAVRMALGAWGEPGTTSTLTNGGTISANGGEWTSEQDVAVSVGVAAAISGEESAFELDNGGAIEATGTGSVAIYVAGQDYANAFTLTNRGTVRGRAQTVFEDGQTPNIETSGSPLAGAIHTVNTIDLVRNEASALIEGNVDLGAYNDEFHNYGTMTGEVRLGAGSDSYVIGAGGTLTGRVDGGADFDAIHVDLTGSAHQRINASQFANFEALTALAGTSGTGKVSLFGHIDAASWLISNITLHVDAGDTLSSANGSNGNTIYGGDGQETVDNAGTITGGLSLGQGDDTLVNSGTIGASVSMGSGNDVVTNSGTIEGDLLLGSGDDRYEALGGLVTGKIDGGIGGNDTFVFRMNGDNGAIPGGFTNFESFGAYGPGTLTLALVEDYNTIELLEGANLVLQDGDGTVGLIKGDDSAQDVRIEDADFDGAVSLGGGDDSLTIELSGALTGSLDGGAGTDTLNLRLGGASTIHDLYGFEIVNAAGSSPLTLTGTLAAGQQINFDDADNTFVVAAGATFAGTANGGAGTDTLQVETGAADSRTIVAGQVVAFEKLVAGGAGTLALEGESYSFESVDVEGDLSIGEGASLASADGVRFGDGDNRLTLIGTGTVTSPIEGGAGIDTLAFVLAGGQTRSLGSPGRITGFERLAAAGEGTLDVNRDASFDSVVLQGGKLSVATGATLDAAITGEAGNDTVTIRAGGTVKGDINLGAGNDTLDNSGTITGDVDLGDGDDRYIARDGGLVTGTLDGGAGNNTFIFNLNGGNGEIPGSVVNFNSFGVYGPGTLAVNLDAGQTYHNLELIEGANLVLSGTGGSVANVIGDDSAQSVTIDGGLTGGVFLGGGDDTLTMHLEGLLGGALDGGEGTDTLNLTLTGDATIAGMHGFEIANITGDAVLTLSGDLGAGQQVTFTGETNNELVIGAGTVFAGRVDGGAGHDLLRVRSGDVQDRTVVASQIVSFEELVAEGAGTLALTAGNYVFDAVAVTGGNLELGAGTHLDAEGGVTFDGADNRFTLGSGATLRGPVDGGAGTDTLALIQDAGAVRLLGDLAYSGFEVLESSGAGELRIDRDAAFTDGVRLDGGVTRVLAGNVLTAMVAGGAGDEVVELGGTVEGDLDLGAGNDRLILTGTGLITGSRHGGEGIDRLVFNTVGTYEAPTVFDGTGYSGFETLGVAGGTVSLTGNSSWDGVEITGGRLIGQAGTTLTSASAIKVAHGATFGSAGLVDADIEVAGTLSPGASPGTMTVNGNVSFAAGSNLLLEVSPTVSDLLQISGKLTIAEGAAVDITGVLHGAPGNLLDLVVAEGGITGRFTTINKSEDVFGFVVVNGNRLQIRNEFLSAEGQPSNIRASVDYANTVLAGGYGVQAFTDALPLLVDAQGAIERTPFAQLTPEAYASATQLGVDNSLAVADAASMFAATASSDVGLFSFGAVLGHDGSLDRQGGNTGASKAHSEGRGFVGGIGFGFAEGTRIGAFAGGLDSEQTIDGLAAATELDSFVAGVFADARVGGLGAHGLIAFNGGTAETRRDLLVAETDARARYELRNWVADLGVDYQVKLGSWVVAPTVGVTYVGSRREGALEQGPEVFALRVDGARHHSWFADAALAFSGDLELGQTAVSPYASFGVRQALGGRSLTAEGGFEGTEGEMTVRGIERDRTVGRIELGLGLDLGGGVRVHAGYGGEFGGTTRTTATGGVSLRF